MANDSITTNEEITTNQVNWQDNDGCRVYVPEGYEGTLDVIVYVPGAGGGGVNSSGDLVADTIPYEELARENPDKIIIYDTSSGAHIDNVVSTLEQINNEGNVSVGVIDINAHSAGDVYAIRGANALYDAGFEVSHATIFDGSTSLRYLNNLPANEWEKFASTGAELNVFSRGADGYINTELDRLSTASKYGIPVTYSLCDFDGSNDWGEKHAAVNRDLVVNGLMDIYDGTKGTFTFDKRLTNDDYNGIYKYPSHVTGISYTKQWDYENNCWNEIYNKDINGDDYSDVVSVFSANASNYTTGGLSNLIGNVHNELNRMTALLGAFSTTFNTSIQPLPDSEHLVVCKEELETFKNSQILKNLNATIGETGSLQSLINSFRDNGLIKGEVWNLAKDKLYIYDEALEKCAKLADELGQAISVAIDQLLACYERHGDVPADQIQTSNLTALQEELTRLKTELDNTPEKVLKYDDVKKAFYEAENENYDIAKANYEEAKRLVEAVVDFKNTYATVKAALDEAMNNLKDFGSLVASITPSPAYTYTAV